MPALPEPSAPRPVWPGIAAPEAPRLDHEIVQLGRQRNDPYAWMKFIPESGSRTMEGLPPRLRAHLQAEMAYAEAMLRPLAPLAADFNARMHALAPEIDIPLPVSSRGWRYSFRIPAGGAHRIFTRTSATGEEPLLFDEAARAEGHAYYRAIEHQHSPDDRYFAWAEDLVGNDRHRICRLDMRTGEIRVLVEGDAFGYRGFTFSPSSRHLFWIWRDAHSRPTRVYRTPVEGGEAALVYEEQDPAIFLHVARTAADSFVALTMAGPDMAEVRLIAADAEEAEPMVVRPRRRGVTYEVNEWAGMLLLLTDEDAAIDRKLLALGMSGFEALGELVPHREGVQIVAILPFAEALVRLERVDGLHRLVLMQADGAEKLIGFDDPAYAIQLLPAQEYGAGQVRIVHQTPANPPRWIDIELATGARRTVGQERLRGFDPENYVVERLEARALDGAMVPITLLSRRDMENAPAPLLLTGYGAYGFSSEPLFSLPATVLVDAGFRYAIAHVRGGSEKGRRWFLEGRRMRKRNSMTDFIACARHLQEAGLAAPGKIVAHGGSAGGLLVCGAMNIEPSMWAGVIAQVPFVDMLNTMSDAEHPLVPLFRPDWGDPLSDPQAYDYIASISPYENVGPGAYPPLLCTAGLKDDRVPYWEPGKLIANIRHRAAGGSPALLWLHPDSGHQSSGDLDSRFAEVSTLWAFARHCVGGATPPPAP
ncbi:prolyl oligopeptidase family serine peptidase [Sandaracinobacter sp. RS1-74]|uniref:S9 family peptidase n=1 Tax=Sandaracinobacteroides sayramensis TaxID=2913411 RepID=UPI001EDAD6D9|nr:prolyl oligopeptidase family serine peptidase [Sandaracinobacteroides sayramensis]MCG2842628.1 prolyl oligopeptidase family serine peptidase [Sandaracinobacteroides sayramensis]